VSQGHGAKPGLYVYFVLVIDLFSSHSFEFDSAPLDGSSDSWAPALLMLILVFPLPLSLLKAQVSCSKVPKIYLYIDFLSWVRPIWWHAFPCHRRFPANSNLTIGWWQKKRNSLRSYKNLWVNLTELTYTPVFFVRNKDIRLCVDTHSMFSWRICFFFPFSWRCVLEILIIH
jgi:hypothetical protein